MKKDHTHLKKFVQKKLVSQHWSGIWTGVYFYTIIILVVILIVANLITDYKPLYEKSQEQETYQLKRLWFVIKREENSDSSYIWCIRGWQENNSNKLLKHYNAMADKYRKISNSYNDSLQTIQKP